MGSIQNANWLYIRRLLRTRTARLLLLLLFLASILDVLRVHRAMSPDAPLDEHGSPHPPPALPPGTRVYIAAMHFNSGAVLRAHWCTALLHLVDTLGAANVFVSIYESGSWDETKFLLRWLDGQLEVRGVPRRVQIDDETHEEVIEESVSQGVYITGPGGEPVVRRIPYLAKSRNKTLKDLVDLSTEGARFDKVLFLNDVVFSTDDVLTLMDTNGGKYAAACSLDFKDPPYYYDTFALRDAQGETGITSSWPYFRSGRSREGLMRNDEAVPVTSCWNGIVVMPAAPFVSASNPLQFRAIDDSLARHHLEGSECCLIHVDNPLSRDLGVYVNPRVRVGYDSAAYEGAHPSAGGAWVSTWSMFWGLWANRLAEWTVWLYEDSLVKRKVRRRLGAWEKEDKAHHHEPADICLINEMQILVWNGWAHV